MAQKEFPKLSFLIPALTGGGAERSMVNLANELRGMDYPVDFLVLQSGGAYEGTLRSDVNLISLHVNRALRAPGPIRAYLKSAQPHALFSALEHINVAVYRGWHGSGVKTLYVPTIRNHISVEAAKAGLVKKIELKWASVAYRKAHAVIAVSQGVARDAEKTLHLAPGTVSTIYNPVVNDSLNRQAKELPEHRWLQDKSIPVVLGVGRLNYQKDWPVLIDACAIVRKSRPVRLLILGEGELRTELEAKIKALGASDWIDLPGFASNPFAAMANCSLFVLSSKFEGLPGVLIQAMACGAPVVSTDCPSGPDEILQGGKYGRLVPVGDAQSMAAAILKTLDDPISVDPAALSPFESETSARQYLQCVGL